MIPIQKVKDIIAKHNDLEKELSSGILSQKSTQILEVLYLLLRNMLVLKMKKRI